MKAITYVFFFGLFVVGNANAKTYTLNNTDLKECQDWCLDQDHGGATIGSKPQYTTNTDGTKNTICSCYN
jgi:hypothetical protein